MLIMEHDIIINGYRIGMVDSVKVKRSVETLSDTAEIVLPAMYCNKSLGLENKLKVNSQVTIKLGYGDRLQMEFEGYVDSITTDNSGVKINCIDSLRLFKKKLSNQELKGVSLQELLTVVCRQMGDFVLDCDYDYKYDKFVFMEAEGYDVLKKVQEETKANIYFEGNTLHVHPPYKEIANKGVVLLDFAQNIEKSDLKYLTQSDRKMQVKVKGTKPNGETVEYEYGTTGGESKQVVAGTTDPKEIQQLAKTVWEQYVFDGYEGSVTCWLLPFVSPSYQVKIIDEDYPYKTGVYYVTGTEVSFGSGGGPRKIKLGRKVKL